MSDPTSTEPTDATQTDGTETGATETDDVTARDDAPTEPDATTPVVPPPPAPPTAPVPPPGPRTIPPAFGAVIPPASGPILPGPPRVPPPSGPILPGPPPLPPPPKRSRGPATPPHPVVRVLFLLGGALFTLTVLFWGTFSIVNIIGHVTEVQSVTFGGNVKAIVIRSGTGPISLRGGERSDISGQRTIEHGWQNPALDEHMDGDTLYLSGRCAVSALVWCNVHYSLDVPRGIRVDAQTGAGSVDVTGIDGDVEARAGAGTVELTDVHGNLHLSSGAGTVRGSLLRSDVVDASSGAGSVFLEFVAPPSNVTVESGAGSVDVQVPNDGTAYQVSGDSGHGGRKIDVPTAPTSTHAMHLQSGAGSTRLHLPS